MSKIRLRMEVLVEDIWWRIHSLRVLVATSQDREQALIDCNLHLSDAEIGRGLALALLAPRQAFTAPRLGMDADARSSVAAMHGHVM